MILERIVFSSLVLIAAGICIWVNMTQMKDDEDYWRSFVVALYALLGGWLLGAVWSMTVK